MVSNVYLPVGTYDRVSSNDKIGGGGTQQVSGHGYHFNWSIAASQERDVCTTTMCVAYTLSHSCNAVKLL